MKENVRTLELLSAEKQKCRYNKFIALNEINVRTLKLLTLLKL